MTTLKNHPRSILGLLGVSPSRRRGAAPTRRRAFLPDLERFEVRLVPTVSILAPQGGTVALADLNFNNNTSSAIPLGPYALEGSYGSNAYKFIQNGQGEIGVKFSLSSAGIAALTAADMADPTVTHGFQITLDSYFLSKQGSPESQTLIRTVADARTDVLTLNNQMEFLFVEVDDKLCSQVDALNGATDPVDVDHNNVLAGAVFHPHFTGGVESFEVEATNLNGQDAPHAYDLLASECPSAKIGNFGLSIGFWKNHHANWQVYGPNTTLGSVFSGLNDYSVYSGLAGLTFDQALSLGGGPSLSDKAGLLVKQAVGSLLNAANDKVGFPLTTSQIKVAVDDALASLNATTINNLQTQLMNMNGVENSAIIPIPDSKKK